MCRRVGLREIHSQIQFGWTITAVLTDGFCLAAGVTDMRKGFDSLAALDAIPETPAT
jgi:hypothetical protein